MSITFWLVVNTGVPIRVFDNYVSLIRWIRRNKVSEMTILASELNNVEDSMKDVSELVYADAYNNFVDYRDINFMPYPAGPTETCQQLEEDRERLDWMEAHGNGQPWIARQSDTGRGFRLHNSTRTGGSDTVREAIDKARFLEKA